MKQMRFLLCAKADDIEQILIRLEQSGCPRAGPILCEKVQVVVELKCVSLKVPLNLSEDEIFQLVNNGSPDFVSCRLDGYFIFCPEDFIPKAVEMGGSLLNLIKMIGQKGDSNGRVKTFK